MKLTINNFGPVRGKQNYQIDLNKDFTLVTGGNGLGKTYLGYLIYGLIKRIYDSKSTKTSSAVFKRIGIDKDLNDNNLLINFSYSDFVDFIDEIINSYKENIHVYMGIDRRSADRIFNDLKFDFFDLEELYSLFVENDANRILKSNMFGTITIKKEKSSSQIEISSDDKKVKSLPIAFLLDPILSELIYDKTLLNNFIMRVFYIPVERNSLYTFSKELSLKRSDKLQQMQLLLLEEGNGNEIPNFLKRNANRYPEAIEDALRQAQDLTQLTKNDADLAFIELATEIESEILHGEIVVNSEGEVEFAPNKNRNKRVPVHLSASFIKTVSSIIFYLKHIATKGDMMMIDEPEMNLHPNYQILFARILARISNAGVKVWMSTHSDYIISELNNLCLVGVLNEKGLKEETAKWGYKTSDYLDKTKMQAFYLNGEKYQTQVKIENLKIGDHGVDIASIDDCLYKLNTRTNELDELYENMD